MKIENLSQFKKLVQLCREHGVTNIDIDGIKMNISPKPQTQANTQLELQPEAYVAVPRYAPIQAQETQDAPVINPDSLSDEQMLFYSAKGEPQ